MVTDGEGIVEKKNQHRLRLISNSSAARNKSSIQNSNQE